MASNFGFDEKTKRTDLTLTMQGQCVYVSRAVLELTSPVFQALLDANEENNEIELEGKNFDDFVEFLACFYPGKSHKVTSENVFRMLPLADEYGICHVINQCEVCLQTMLDSVETPVEHFFRCVEVIYKHNIEDLKPRCLKAFEERSLDDIQMSCDQLRMYSSAKADLYDSLVPKLINDVHKYKYLFACLCKKRASKLQEWQEVKYFTIDMSMQADVAGVQKSDSFEAWNMKWLINISRYTFEGVLGTFLASLHCCPNQNTELVSCEGAVTFTVKNNIPWNDNVTKETQFTLTSSKLTSSDVRLQEKALFDRDAGFLMDKKYQITAHVLIQRPKFRLENDLETSSENQK